MCGYLGRFAGSLQDAGCWLKRRDNLEDMGILTSHILSAHVAQDHRTTT
jgi:hypothetical protein